MLIQQNSVLQTAFLEPILVRRKIATEINTKVQSLRPWPRAQTVYTCLDLSHSIFLCTVCVSTNKSTFNPTWMRHLLTSLAQRALLQLCDTGRHIRNVREASVSTTECDFMILQRSHSVASKKLETKQTKTLTQRQVVGYKLRRKQTKNTEHKPRVSYLSPNPWRIIWGTFSKITQTFKHSGLGGHL